MDEIWEWFKSLDRRVYLRPRPDGRRRSNTEWKDELVERYRFQLEVQRMYQEARHTPGPGVRVRPARCSASAGQVAPGASSAEVMQVLRQAWQALKNIIQDAREINLPAMKNFEEGERLADFILEGKMVPEPPLSYVKGEVGRQADDQLARRCGSKCFRLHFKSVGGILALQEKIAAEWKEMRSPVEAAVVESRSRWSRRRSCR